MPGLCEGRVVVVTGAGRGIGRGHALELARQGARVVVNDLGSDMDGSGSSDGPAGEVVDAIRAMGGEAIADGSDVSTFNGAERLIGLAVKTFGPLDVLVNNAGILRDRMLTNMSEAEWDDVIRVHLKGTFGPSHFAAAYWRDQSKQTGGPLDARIINTASPTGLFGNPGQTNYGAAKAGIAGFTLTAALELARYGVTVNCISPGALTRMTENLVGVRQDVAPGEFDRLSPDNVAPLVAYLASEASRDITGRVFMVSGGTVTVGEGWERGPSVTKDGRWDPGALVDVVPGLVEQAAPNQQMQD
jgi:NAD(P)-dependent dehydrogenase (short-subunit alcohol dehydrogenase family)